MTPTPPARSVGRTLAALLPVLMFVTATTPAAATLAPATSAPATSAPATSAAATAPTASRAPAWRPPPRTIVAVLGNPDEGFVIRHFDGSVDFPPTWSEAMAECAELDRLLPRARCRTFVRVRYRDLTAVKRAIRWARLSG